MIPARMPISDGPGSRGVTPRVAVVIPCFNEEVTIADVVQQFRRELPDARIWVFDNNSTDRTVERAKAAGARLLQEARRGKGFVVQSIFRHIDADLPRDRPYGFPVHALIAPIAAGDADMVVGSRLHAQSRSEFKQVNRWANRLVLLLLKLVFRVRLTDVLSGYRAFNRRFVKNLALFGGGFEVETELTIKAVMKGYRIAEIPVDLVARPGRSHSKVRLFRDGMVILSTILTLFRDYKPLTFFGSLGLLLILAALVPAFGIVAEYFARGSALKLPSAILAVGLGLGGMMSIAIGLLLHSIARRAQEFDYQVQMLSDEIRREQTTANEDSQ